MDKSNKNDKGLTIEDVKKRVERDFGNLLLGCFDNKKGLFVVREIELRVVEEVYVASVSSVKMGEMRVKWFDASDFVSPGNFSSVGVGDIIAKVDGWWYGGGIDGIRLKSVGVMNSGFKVGEGLILAKSAKTGSKESGNKDIKDNG